MAPYDIIKQGYLLLLTAKGGTFQRKKWAKYWFLFIEDATQLALIYFKSEEQYIAREKNVGFIRFDDCLSFSVIGQQGSTLKNAMVVNTPKKRYIIAAESRYELHEWVYQLHNSLDEFRKKQHGIYAIVANANDSSALENFRHHQQQKQPPQEQQQPQQSSIYAVVKKTGTTKPTRQAPPVPPRSKEMAILSDSTPSESAIENTGAEGDSGVQSRATLMSFGSGSDVDHLSYLNKHRRSLSDSMIVGKINMDTDLELLAADQEKAVSAIKKTSSDTDLPGMKLVTNGGFELPTNVKKKKPNKRRKTIATGIGRHSQSPPLDPPPPPPADGDSKPEVNQAIIEALYALDEELGQNTALSPKNSMSTVAPIQIDHTTLFATFQSPPESAHDPMSSTTGHVLSPVNPAAAYSHSESVTGQQHEQLPNGDVVHEEQQNGDIQRDEEVDFQGKCYTSTPPNSENLVKPLLAPKPKLDKVSMMKGDTTKEEISKPKKVPPPVKPKPPKPSPPHRTTSYSRAVQLHVSKSGSITVAHTNTEPSAVVNTGHSKKLSVVTQVTEQQKRSPPRVVFPQDSDKAVNRKGLTTFSLDDLNKDTVQRGGGNRGIPLSPKVLNSGSFSAYKPNNLPPSHNLTPEKSTVETSNDDVRIKETKRMALETSSKPLVASVSITQRTSTPSSSKTISAIFQSVVGDMLPNDESPVTTTTTSPTHNNPEDSMTKIFQNWPISNSDMASHAHSASDQSKWKDSQAHQHIYDDPWDKKIGDHLSRSQSNLKAGDRNSLERQYVTSSARMKAGDRNSLERPSNLVTGPRRGNSIENIYKRSVNTSSPESLRVKGASAENLSKMDPTSPLYLYKKALKNHEHQQQQQQQEKEKSYTLPLKGDKFSVISKKGDRRLSQQTLLQQSSLTSLRPRSNTAAGGAPPARMFTSMQDVSGDRKMSLPVQPQQLRYPQPVGLQTQQPRTASNLGYYPKTNPTYKPYVLNTNGRPISAADQHTINLARRDSKKTRPAMVANPVPTRRQDDWRYVKQGTQMTYDRDSDGTILRSLV